MMAVLSNHPLVAVYGSPRAHGNSDRLLDEAVKGARQTGAGVVEIRLRELDLTPCREDYGCLKDGRCIIEDDFQAVYDHLASCQGLMLASPVFFCAVSAHTKIFMDRCQSFWVRQQRLGLSLKNSSGHLRQGLFISVAARQSQRNFDGSLLSVRHFFSALDVELRKTLLYAGVEGAGDVETLPRALEECRRAGAELAGSLVGKG